MALTTTTSVSVSTNGGDAVYADGHSPIIARSDGEAAKGSKARKARKAGEERATDAAAPTSMQPKANRPVTTALGISSTAKRKTAAVSGSTKVDIVLRKLRTARGVTIAQLAEATGWQTHSVRGFLSAVVRKKLGLALVTEIGKDGMRRYRISSERHESGSSEVVGVAENVDTTASEA